MDKRYIDIAEVAKIIRSELRAAFPATKFSVRSSRYSMGCNITVSWTNGPTTKAVETITDRFYGTGFDGMTDSTTHHDTEWNGEVVHFAGSRPHCSRTVTPDLEAKMAQAWEALNSSERCALLNKHDFPSWPEDRPGLRLAYYVGVAQ